MIVQPDIDHSYFDLETAINEFARELWEHNWPVKGLVINLPVRHGRRAVTVETTYDTDFGPVKVIDRTEV